MTAVQVPQMVLSRRFVTVALGCRYSIGCIASAEIMDVLTGIFTWTRLEICRIVLWPSSLDDIGKNCNISAITDDQWQPDELALWIHAAQCA